MASTPEGRRLTELHRLEQQRVRAEFLAQFLVLWELLDSRRLDETGPGWVAAVLAMLRPFREQSARVAVNYFTEFREVELPRPGRPDIPVDGNGPGGEPGADESEEGRSSSSSTPDSTPVRPVRRSTRPVSRMRPNQGRAPGIRWDVDLPTDDRPAPRVRVDIPELDWKPLDRAAKTSLTVTGPVFQKAKTARGKPLQVARDESFVSAAGAASRHVLTGGRKSLLTLIEDDSTAIGWIRVTDGNPCAFCAMLASRGPVYERSSGVDANTRFEGPGSVKVHDNCACTLEPVYSRGTAWPGRGAEFRALWREVVGLAPNNRYSGQDAINAFRREYERRQRAAGREVA